MNQQLGGRCVAITGAARGIGLATARAVLDAGGRVAIGDIDPGALEADIVRAAGDNLLVHQLDVRNRSSFSEFLDVARTRFGELDVLVNNAGIMPIGPVLDESDETARRIVDINVHGTILGTKLALERMAPRGHGQIVNVASVAGRVASSGLATYCASKHAIVGFTESVRLEYATSGVQVCMVLPNFTATELIAGTREPRFIGVLTPKLVADAIVSIIDRPRPEIILPSIIAPTVLAQPIMPRRLRHLLTRILATENSFLSPDTEARRGYNTRIG